MIRVEWLAPLGLKGHGEWHDDSQGEVLQRWADAENKRLPGWNHYVARSRGEVCQRTEDGQHRPFSQTFRLPVGWRIEYQAQKLDDPNTPKPLRYWEIETCSRCGHEKITPRGFTPRATSPREVKL